MKVKDQNGMELEVRITGTEPDDLSLYDVYYTDSDSHLTAEVIDYVVTKYADELLSEWLRTYGHVDKVLN